MSPVCQENEFRANTMRADFGCCFVGMVSLNIDKRIVRQSRETPTQWISHLDHESLDDPVNKMTIVISVTTVHAKVFHSLRASATEKQAMNKFKIYLNI